MTNTDFFDKEWSQKAADEEMKLGGIRIGPTQPLGMPTVDDTSDDEETLRHEEELLRQKLAHQLTQMKEREADGKEYLRKHGIIPVLEIPDNAGVYARH